MFCTYTWHVKTRCNCSWFLYCQQALCGKLKIFLNAMEAAQFLNPTHRDIQMCLWGLFYLESGLRMQHTREQHCLRRGEAEYKGRNHKIILFLDRPDMPRHWDSSQCYRARGTWTVHHKTKQNQLFVRSPTLRQLSLILPVSKGCISVHLCQPLDWHSKGLSIRDALVKHKLLTDAEILKWNTAAKALQMAHCSLLYSGR